MKAGYFEGPPSAGSIDSLVFRAGLSRVTARRTIYVPREARVSTLTAEIIVTNSSAVSDASAARALAEHASSVVRYARAAIRDATSVLAHETFKLDHYYVHPLRIQGHGRGAHVIYHRIHEPIGRERKLGLSKFLRDATPQVRF